MLRWSKMYLPTKVNQDANKNIIYQHLCCLIATRRVVVCNVIFFIDSVQWVSSITIFNLDVLCYNLFGKLSSVYKFWFWEWMNTIFLPSSFMVWKWWRYVGNAKKCLYPPDRDLGEVFFSIFSSHSNVLFYLVFSFNLNFCSFGSSEIFVNGGFEFCCKFVFKNSLSISNWDECCKFRQYYSWFEELQDMGSVAKILDVGIWTFWQYTTGRSGINLIHSHGFRSFIEGKIVVALRSMVISNNIDGI